VVTRWQVDATFDVYEVTLPALSGSAGSPRVGSAGSPPGQGGPADLWLETETWNPAALGLSTDARDLGVMVDWIEVLSDG
jgi:hypothetical protein